MKPTIGNSAAQRNRDINGNKEKKASVKIKLMAPKAKRHKKFIHTLKGNLPRNLQARHEGYKDNNQDQSPYSDMDEETILPESEQTENWNSQLSVRPLIQLFAEESSLSKGSASVPDEKSLTSAMPQIIYSDISLLSEEEDDSKVQIPVNPLHSRSSNVARFVWTPKSTNIFLDLWEKQLNSQRKITHIQNEIAKEMIEHGPTVREIKAKMDNMSRKYRVESEKVLSGSRTNWQYFKRVQSLLSKEPVGGFEEIMFGSTESSVYIKTDNSDSENYVEDVTFENLTRKESAEFMTNKIKEDKISAVDKSEVTKEHSSPKFQPDENSSDNNTKACTADRMLEIEEEKLLIEKQKLQVMKHISRDLKSIGTALTELLRNTTK